MDIVREGRNATFCGDMRLPIRVAWRARTRRIIKSRKRRARGEVFPDHSKKKLFLA
jgi:hypothetical protein